ncbi:MAG: class I SAM-dependent methyltransferase [Acidobacteria bacterium]|nr:class I SAM-dependent methyltransferase [Acidobacteriota bacterium]
MSAYHQVRLPYDPRRAAVWRAVCSYLQGFLPEQESLLELGAGYGDFSRFVRAREKWALDQNPDLVAHWPPEVHAVTQSATDPLPIPSASLGAVFASNFFEHFTLDECRSVLAEARRVLRPGGRLIVVQPNFRLEPRRYYDDYTHKTPFTDVGFAGFLRSLEWRVVHQEPRFLPFTMKSRLPANGWLVRLYLALPYRPLAGQFLLVAEAP